MKILFLGTPKFAKIVLEYLINNKQDIICVITQPDKRVGRRKRIEFNITKKFAIQNNIKVFQPIKINDHYLEIKKLNPDLILTAAYGQFISSEILSLPKYGSLNLHGSLLPKYRGGAPIHHSIINGEKETGVSLIHMTKIMDAGDVIAQKKVKIDDDDNLDSLYLKIAILSGELIIEQLNHIKNKTYIDTKQDDKKISFGYNITSKDEFIDFNRTNNVVFNHIRGLDSIPGGYSMYKKSKIKFFNAFIDKNIDSNKYNKSKVGEILILDKTGLYIKTKDGIIGIKKIQKEGRKKMDIEDFINGNTTLSIGEIFNE